MADYFTKASFLIRVTALESSVIREAFDLRIDELLGEQAASAYQRRSRAFKDLFPEGREESFDRFLSLFTDPENPTAGCNIDEFERSGDSVSLVMYGDQIDPESVANLLQVQLLARCRSASRLHTIAPSCALARLVEALSP